MMTNVRPMQDSGYTAGGTDLDDLAAGLLQVSHLLTNGQGQLEGLGLAGDVLPGERPVQNGDWACSDSTQVSPAHYVALQLQGMLQTQAWAVLTLSYSVGLTIWSLL